MIWHSNNKINLWLAELTGLCVSKVRRCCGFISIIMSQLVALPDKLRPPFAAEQKKKNVRQSDDTNRVKLGKGTVEYQSAFHRPAVDFNKSKR